MRWREIKHTKPKRRPESAPKVTYADFKSRALAFITDIFMIGIPITLIIMIAFGHDQMMNSAGGTDVLMNPAEAKQHAPNPYASITQMLLYAVTFVLFWHKSGQTPGKKMMQIRVVDAQTFRTASWSRLFLRFVGYFLSALTLVGFFTGLLRRDGRALHDLLSGTAVIRA
ncbi:RDD family protein [Sulfurimonas sp. HSL-3221]|uniref:RDD family protein n=1 Tax=Sulfurimonadaceae TaxID=2771471 RepID=UPI001E5C85C9|nr:RDD family protein [Sulfurimonas sp. HSL-3221]UFS62446.1 RDD family protein [Sulfurimonas sp. HSL-3221]